MGRLSKRRSGSASKSKPSSQIVLTRKGTSRIEKQERDRIAASGDMYLYIALGVLVCVAGVSVTFFIMS